MTETLPTHAGFVALIGAANAGKSTLLNQVVGQKLSIVSRKAQTTRTQIRGIVTEDAVQMIFVDTPGIFRPQKRLERAMVSSAWNGFSDADSVVFIIDAQRGLSHPDVQDILQTLEQSERSVFIALNKIDLLPKEKLLLIATELQKYTFIKEIFMISALAGSGVKDLKKHLQKMMPEGPFLYNPEDVSDLPVKLLAAEITREYLLDLLHDELPYQATVETEVLKKIKSGTKSPLRLEQTIYVTRDAHKRILLGHKGQKIKTIGERARKEISELLERPINLFLFVKVRENWQDDPERYAIWGLEYKK